MFPLRGSLFFPSDRKQETNMSKSMADEPIKTPGFVGHGSDYGASYEDFLVGDEVGLRNLISACEKALQDGECFGGGLGEFNGIKLVDTSLFEADVIPPNTVIAWGSCLLVFGGTVTLIALGVYKIIEWLWL